MLLQKFTLLMKMFRRIILYLKVAIRVDIHADTRVKQVNIICRNNVVLSVIFLKSLAKSRVLLSIYEF